MRIFKRRGSRGFSLIELMVVVAIALATTALVAPSITRAIRDSRLRSSANGLSSLVAQTRALAVRRNCTVTLMSTTNTAQQRATYWAERDGACGGDGALSTADPQMLTERQVLAVTGIGTPATAALGFTPQAAGTPIRFNSRGLPCVRATTVCNNVSGGTPVGFFVTLQDQRSGSSALAGVSISPTGRVNVWRYKSGSWKP